MGNVFKDIVALLANRSISSFAIFRIFLLMLPYVLSFSMPMALLAATLLVMGRFSADQELTACRACGVSLLELLFPILGVTTCLALVSLYVNHSLAPQTKYLFNQVFIDIAKKEPVSLLEEGQWIRDFPDIAIFIRKRDVRDGKLEGVRVIRMQNNRMTEDISAERGIVSSDPEQLKISIALFKVQMDLRDPADPYKRQMKSDTYPPIELDLMKLLDQRRAKQEIHHHTSSELWKQILELEKRGGGHPAPIFVELHKRTALSIACIAFVLIGLPFGIQIQRRETSVGVLISLVLAVVYYLLILIAEGFKDRPHLYPELIVWIPNLLFETIGLCLLWRHGRV